jgi:hypothetical protein
MAAVGGSHRTHRTSPRAFHRFFKRPHLGQTGINAKSISMSCWSDSRTVMSTFSGPEQFDYFALAMGQFSQQGFGKHLPRAIDFDLVANAC